MGNFDRGNRSGGNRSYGGGNRYGGGGGGRPSYGGGGGFRDRDQGGDRPMFQTICAKCGKECEVPFKPTGDRPVYCRDCFRENSEGGESRRPDERSYSRPSQNETPSYKEEFQALSNKLDRIIDLLTPQSKKDEYAPAAEVSEEVVTDEVATEAPAKKKSKKAPKAPEPVEIA
jgi:CxxC-x17-CxxC domain-containing protein